MNRLIGTISPIERLHLSVQQVPATAVFQRQVSAFAHMFVVVPRRRKLASFLDTVRVYRVCASVVDAKRIATLLLGRFARLR